MKNKKGINKYVWQRSFEMKYQTNIKKKNLAG